MKFEIFDSDGVLQLTEVCSDDAGAREIVKSTSARTDLHRWVLRDEEGIRAIWIRLDSGPTNLSPSYRYTES